MSHVTSTADDARFIFEEWDRLARERDVDGLVGLYADDDVAFSASPAERSGGSMR
jgi:ketosteroid isomerase-like protein